MAPAGPCRFCYAYARSISLLVDFTEGIIAYWYFYWACALAIFP